MMIHGIDENGTQGAAVPEPMPRCGSKKVLPELIMDMASVFRGSVFDAISADLTARGAAGEKKYKTPLMSHNGRDAIMDAYQEALDMCMYLSQRRIENWSVNIDGIYWDAIDLAVRIKLEIEK